MIEIDLTDETNKKWLHPTGKPVKTAKNSVETNCVCCSGYGEHDTGFECYRCDASGLESDAEGDIPCDGRKDSPNIIFEDGIYEHKNKVENKGGNPNHDKLGRFSTGSTSFMASSPEDADKFVAKSTISATPEQTEHARYWAGAKSSYEYINEHLRGLSTSLTKSSRLNDIDKPWQEGPKLGDVIKSMDTLTRNNKAEKSFVSYRQFELTHENAAKLTRGATFTDKGYISTTLDKDHAKNFSQFARPGKTKVFANIKVGKGQSGVFIGKLVQDAEHEVEFTLPRNSTFKVQAETTYDTFKVVTLEVQ